MNNPGLIPQIVDFVFDNLFLLIIIASFILPLFTRKGKPQSTAQRPGNRPATSDSAKPAAEPGEFQKRLEEARRRVEEASRTSSADASIPDSSSATMTTTEADQPWLKADTSSQAPDQPWLSKTPGSVPEDQPWLSKQSSVSVLGSEKRSENPLLEADSISTFLPSQVQTSFATFGDEQAPLQVVRRKQKSRAASKGNLLNLDPESINKGFIWHYILSEPLSRKRRKVFPHQS